MVVSQCVHFCLLYSSPHFTPEINVHACTYIAGPNLTSPGEMVVGMSGPQVNENITFAAGEMLFMINITFEIWDDDVALEDPEMFNLTLSSLSSPQECFARTEITIRYPNGTSCINDHDNIAIVLVLPSIII